MNGWDVWMFVCVCAGPPVRPMCHVFVCLRPRLLLRLGCRMSRGRANSVVRADNVVALLLFLGPTIARPSSVCVLSGNIDGWMDWGVTGCGSGDRPGVMGCGLGPPIPPPHGLWVGGWAGLSWAVGLVSLPPPHNNVKYADG